MRKGSLWYIGIVFLGLSALAYGHVAAESVPPHAQLAALTLFDPGSLCGYSHTTSTGFLMLVGVGLLTGFSHCVGMCGPLVGAFTMRRRSAMHEVSTPLVLYQLGRVMTYALLGATAGSVGALAIESIRDWQGVLSITLGFFVVMLGLSLLGLLPLQRWLARVVPARLVSRWVQNRMRSHHPAAPLALGIANGLLPCGPVYTMALLAALSGGPLQGASLMFIFGLGTLPAMLGLGFSSAMLSIRLRTQLHRIAALVAMGVGLQLALRGLALQGYLPHTSIGGVMLW